MLSAFGFLRFSCSLLVHCFVRTKRRKSRGPNRHTGSDSDDDDVVHRPRTCVSAAKSALAKVVVRVRPPRPVSKPRLGSLWTYLLAKKRFTQPVIPAIDAKNEVEGEFWATDAEVRHRRALANNSNASFSNVFDAIPWPPMESTESSSAASLSSGQSAYYASDRSESDFESCDFDLRSDFSPRTSFECMGANQGLNPTFYGMEMSDDEELCPLQKTTAMRRLDSVVNHDAKLKNIVQIEGKQQLLVNPAYGADSAEPPEDSEAGEGEWKTETKMKSLKSVVKAGCLALPTSTALVGSQYIGHTSLNPTYGDLDSESETSDDDAPLDSDTPLTDLPQSPFQETASKGAEMPLKGFPCLSPRSMPLLSFRDLAESGTDSKNMGTLTWRNVAFSASEGSDLDDTCLETHPAVADLEIQWKEKLRADSIDLPSVSPKLPSSPSMLSKHDSTTQTQSFPSSFLEDVHLQSSTNGRDEVQIQAPSLVKVKGITKTFVTPVRSLPADGFEDIDFGFQTRADLPRSAPCNKASNKTSSNLFSTGLKHTRWALRSISLFFDRVEILSPSDKQK